MEAKTVRFPMMVEPSLIERIDEWSFSNRVRTRSEAVRLLVRKGLSEDHEKENAGASRA